MNRTLIAGSALALGTGCQRRIDPAETEKKMSPESLNIGTRKTITEPARDIPVLAETDVLVIGGGPAGTAAAIAASRAGAETYLVERYNHLGGLWTGGMVLPLFSTHALDRQNKMRQVIFGIGGEMATRLKDLGMSIDWPWQGLQAPLIDPEAGKYVLDEMISEAGVKMIYHAWGANAIMSGNTIKGVFIESKSGRMAILAKVVVDCTGDGDVFHWAGEDYDVMEYHVNLVHRLGNIDRIDTTKPGYTEMPLGNPTPIPSVNWVNMYGRGEEDALDVVNLSRIQIENRRDIWKSFEKIRETPGYEEVFLLDTAPQLGVRISRILEGEYTLTLEDTMTYKSFDDVIGICGAWTTMLYNGERVRPADRPMWQIPYRSILPKKTENLLVAGRCFCFERELMTDTRVIGPALITGHGAGAAAALAVKDRETVRNVNTGKLKKLLLEQGAWLG